MMAQDDEDDAARGANSNSRATTVIAVNSSPPAAAAAVPAAASAEDVVEGVDPGMLQIKHHHKVSRSSSDRLRGDSLRLLRRTLTPSSTRSGGGGTWHRRDVGILFRRLSLNTRSFRSFRRRRRRSGGAAQRGAASASATLASMSTTHGEVRAKGKKLGHRRVQTGGEVTYKKFETTQLMGSIQLGIQQSVGSLANQPDRDLLIKDFKPIETVAFTKDGNLEKTPAHNYSEFRFRTYAGFAFKKYRQIFEIDESEFLVSICSVPMVELSNPGASGSIFYITQDDMFICKTVMRKEADFLQKLLPAYYMNLNQNPRTLLPKFFGLYCYSCNAKNVRIIVMNNLLPSALKMHHRFDLKGSTYKRKASNAERDKKSPTYKDLDFLEMYPEGILLQPELYDNLLNSIQRDCRVLESFKIMDYSLLIGIHNLDQAAKENVEAMTESGSEDGSLDMAPPFRKTPLKPQNSVAVGPSSLERTGSITYREGRPAAIAHSTALESINMVEADASVLQVAETGSIGSAGSTGSEEYVEGEDTADNSVKNVWGGIPAKNHRGENLLLFIGIIDILQSYGMLKKAEHYWKSLVHDGDTVSVHRPSFYAKRFQSFMRDRVFKMVPSPLRSGPSFRRSQFRRTMSKTEADVTPAAGAALAAAAAAAASSSPPPPVVVVARDEDAQSAHDESDAKGALPPARGIQDPSAAVTVITIGEGAASSPGDPSSPGPVINLPSVLQDRPARLSISQQGQQQPPPLQQQLQQPQHVPLGGRNSNPRSPPVASSFAAARTDMVASASPEPGHDDHHETGSIITMTSDERVQIYVPSPQTTPYNTIQHNPGMSAAAAAAAAAASKQLEGAAAAAAPYGHIARVGILAGNDSSRSVTPIKARVVTGADSLQTAAAAATTTTSLEMVRISIRSSSSSSSSASAATTTAKATMMEDLPSLPTDVPAESSGPVSLSDVVLVDGAEKRENGQGGDTD